MEGTPSPSRGARKVHDVGGRGLPRRLALALSALLCVLAVGCAAPASALAYEETGIGQETMQPRGGTAFDLRGAHVKSYKSNSAKVVWDGIDAGNVVLCHIDFDSVDPVTHMMSTEDGQRLLDGITLDVVWDGIGSYRGRDVQYHLHVSDMVDCPAHQRFNNNPLCNTGDGHPLDRYTFDFNPRTDREEDGGIGQSWLRGIQSARIALSLEYGDGEVVDLEDEDCLYVTIGQLDADFLGVEGCQLLSGFDHGYLARDTTLVRGSITGASGYRRNEHGFSPTLNGGGYLDSDATPTYYGTWPDGSGRVADDILRGYHSWVGEPDWDPRALEAYDAASAKGYSGWLQGGVCYSTPRGGEATTSFLIIDQVGAIGWPMSLYPLTAELPKAPEKTVDVAEPLLGDEVTYDVTQAVNHEGVDCPAGYRYSSWSLADTLPDGVSYESMRVTDGAGEDVTSQGTVARSGQGVTFSFAPAFLASMPLDGSTYHFAITARVDVGAGTLTNFATTVINGHELVSNAVPIDPRAPALDLVKSSGPPSGATVGPGDVITYELTLVNSGDGRARDVAVYDRIPSATSYVDGSASPGPHGSYDAERKAVSWIVPEVEPGGSVTLGFAARVDGATPDGTSVENAATYDLDHPEMPTEPLPASSNTTTHHVSNPDVTLSKSARPESGSEVLPGGAIAYALRITNDGARAVKDVTVYDNVPEHATYEDGSASPEHAGTYDETHGTVAWTVPELPPGDSVDVSFAVRVDDGCAPDTVIRNVATFATDVPDEDVRPLDGTSNVTEHVVGIMPMRTDDGGRPMPQTGEGLVPVALATGGGLVLGLALLVLRHGTRRHDGRGPGQPRIY